jgi:DNA-binding GntR family transcriptional regulator
MNNVAFDRTNPERELLHVKDNLAAYFREEIISGRLAPGEKIVEVRWAKKLEMSQTSVREALNILSAEGFVQKGSGRTAQVTQLTDEDVVHSYELRAVLEGYAAPSLPKNSRISLPSSRRLRTCVLQSSVIT